MAELTGYTSSVSEEEKLVNQYYDQMISDAQGDRDYIAKYLDAQHEIALGKNDSAQAAFLEKVANKVEEEIGRIPYDYEKYTARELEDYAKTTKQLTEDKDKVLSRLNQDDQTAREGKEIEWGQARQNQAESLVSSGLLTGTREKAGGIAGQRVGQLETQIKREGEALDTTLQRGTEDTMTTFNRGIEEAETSKTRNTQDIADKYRRQAIDTQLTYDQEKERAERALQAAKNQAEQARKVALYQAQGGA